MFELGMQKYCMGNKHKNKDGVILTIMAAITAAGTVFLQDGKFRLIVATGVAIASVLGLVLSRKEKSEKRN